ncbi:hypothetical protein [Winogradskyella sp.]|uniref:hypothetical protein n=1 Tax=Winogradskyella sp. TaxID=1883156 RepID=UPI002623047A|nr:hypothetical protein [Winogradskyella sp.]
MKFKKSKNGQDSIRINTIKRTFCLVLIIALCSTLSLSAQSTPETPEPPATPKTTSSKSYSVTVENDNNEKHNISVSISVSDDKYKFRARYHQSKYEGAKAILLDQLGKSNLKINGNTYLWINKGDDDIFECKLTKKHLRIYLDTEAVSQAYIDKIKALGNELKAYISNHKSKDEKKVKR